MGKQSSIEWLDGGGTWTPIRGKVKEDAAAIAEAKGYTSLINISKKMAGHSGPHCEHASEECDRCYAETRNARCLPHNGTGLPFDRRSRDLVDLYVDEKILIQPLGWRAPMKIFPCSQTDLFGEWVPDEMIDATFDVMKRANWHEYLVLTKRARRMRDYFTDRGAAPPHIRLGVSVGNQPAADARIRELLWTPAATRWISYEPALGAVDFRRWLFIRWQCSGCREFFTGPLKKVCPVCSREGYWTGSHEFNGRHSGTSQCGSGIDWAVVGGESGPGARPFNVQWAIDTVAQFRAAMVPLFVKQLGARPYKMGPDASENRLQLNDKKGGDWKEWLDAGLSELCVRQYPQEVATDAASR